MSDEPRRAFDGAKIPAEVDTADRLLNDVHQAGQIVQLAGVNVIPLADGRLQVETGDTVLDFVYPERFKSARELLNHIRLYRKELEIDAGDGDA